MLALDGLDRHTPWNLVDRLPLDFATFHPQGLAFAAGLTFLSSVEIQAENRGVGHVFIVDKQGALQRDLIVGDGEMYHPGGIDFDGSLVWVSVAQYRPGGQSMIMTIDPETAEIRERFRVDDHVSWVVCDLANALVHGASWGSREFYTWTIDGALISRWKNPSGFIDYQDCRFVGESVIVASGIAVLPAASGTCELGGLALIDTAKRAIVHEFPMSLYSAAGHTVTRNPFSVSVDAGSVTMWVAPDDGGEGNGTEILTYRTTIL
ncbi:hypothetical protein SAMN05216368_11377 [Cryobacterium flavum]|uniref:Glutamine cyclotransferase n=1 Tax=Cryobacterium flavum TaxID=1424659 RepID=A0A4R8V7T0_9MICO|nr:DUF6454 family protein [Cryobacterium flavum]TFB78014.1 hypothetical protein E3O21_07055 [Cryobacterium flavum]SDO25784.1 hypothetical protein SAMN05216368_11377 [Cryobacterium flavum]